MSVLLSFLGGTAFRMIWGEVSAWVNKRQEHSNEMERMRFERELAAENHSRTMESLRLQADLGIRQITAQSVARADELAGEAFTEGVKSLSVRSGFKIIDAWKSAIQPAIATVMLALVVKHFSTQGWVLDDRGWELAGAALGLFLADRLLFRRGK